MNSSANQALGNGMQLLTLEDVDQISGGVIPIALAVWYTGGFVAGVAAGWTFGTTIWQ